jgi:branched-chain amino acid aminotransferase
MSGLAKRVVEGVPNYADLIVYCGGEYVPTREAAVSVWDHGFIYGDGVFEGIRVYGGAFFRMKEHMDRLYESMHSIGLAPPFASQDEASEIAAEVIRRNGLDESHMRFNITRGVGAAGMDPALCATPTVVVTARPLGRGAVQKPITLMTTAIRRNNLGSVDAKVKSLNYMASVLAKHSASVYGADDAVMLDTDGSVAEASASNILAIRDGVLCAPPTTFSLAGITRRTFLELAEESGIPTSVGQLSTHDLYTAEEVFLCGTGSEVVPVVSIDGRKIRGGAPGPVTSKLGAAYFDCVYNRDEFRTPIR